MSHFVVGLYRFVRDTKANWYASDSAMEPWNIKAMYSVLLCMTHYHSYRNCTYALEFHDFSTYINFTKVWPLLFTFLHVSVRFACLNISLVWRQRAIEIRCGSPSIWKQHVESEESRHNAQKTQTYAYRRDWYQLFTSGKISTINWHY
jgi:hypothetical protein